MFRKFNPVGLALLTLITGSPALAQELRRAASYHDLDLTTAAGIEQLNHRVHKAITFVCALAAPGDPLMKPQGQGCQQDAMNQAKPQIDRAVLTAELRSNRISAASR